MLLSQLEKIVIMKGNMDKSREARQTAEKTEMTEVHPRKFIHAKLYVDEII